MFGFNETFLGIYAAVQVALVTPFVQWLKAHIPGDFPIKPVTMTIILSFLAGWGLLQIPNLQSDWTWAMLIGLAMAGNTVSQITHAGYKTGKKKVNGG